MKALLPAAATAAGLVAVVASPASASCGCVVHHHAVRHHVVYRHRYNRPAPTYAANSYPAPAPTYTYYNYPVYRPYYAYYPVYYPAYYPGYYAPYYYGRGGPYVGFRIGFGHRWR